MKEGKRLQSGIFLRLVGFSVVKQQLRTSLGKCLANKNVISVNFLKCLDDTVREFEQLRSTVTPRKSSLEHKHLCHCVCLKIILFLKLIVVNIQLSWQGTPLK